MQGWQESETALEVSLRFADFNAAFGFMTQVAALAQAHDHHPDWRNVYNRVDIRLTTHDAGNTVTQRDRDLATAISELADYAPALG